MSKQLCTLSDSSNVLLVIAIPGRYCKTARVHAFAVLDGSSLLPVCVLMDRGSQHFYIYYKYQS